VVIYYDEKIMGHEDLDLNLMQAFMDVNSKSGTLFDPLVVDAFMKSEDEIIEMIKRNLD
jgi:response regulator RpfG family c-di-GMP phosphodiesterase